MPVRLWIVPLRHGMWDLVVLPRQPLRAAVGCREGNVSGTAKVRAVTRHWHQEATKKKPTYKVQTTKVVMSLMWEVGEASDQRNASPTPHHILCVFLEHGKRGKIRPCVYWADKYSRRHGSNEHVYVARKPPPCHNVVHTPVGCATPTVC